MQLFYDEYKKTSELRHPNILTPKEIGEWNNKPYIVFPLCEGSLMNEVHKRAKHVHGELLFSEMELAIILRDISSGLIYLQDNGIIHQDIKPDNILILKEDGENRYVITDFWSKYKIEKNDFNAIDIMKKKTGFSPDYAAPEQFKGEMSIAKVIFFYRLSLIELAVGKLPSDDSKFPLVRYYCRIQKHLH
ncbi:MAG: protein kinase [Saprospiraceae bacterium]|nr:protein kinase [Saprospiraceae bacterium]